MRGFLASILLALAISPALATDDLEVYRACVLSANGSASDKVSACRFEFSEWEYSPNFIDEWEKLLRIDPRVAAIIRQFDKENGTDSF